MDGQSGQRLSKLRARSQLASMVEGGHSGELVSDGLRLGTCGS